MQKLDKPEEVWSKIREAFVLSFRYDRERTSFVLVCDYPPEVPGVKRAFVALVFSGVNNVSRQLGDLAETHRFQERYSSEPGVRRIVVQDIEAKPDAGRTFQDIWFGPNFGGVTFTFEKVEGFLRNCAPGQTTQVDGKWVYRDADTGEPFVFPVPFPALQCPEGQR